jgi:hypothetical protein
LAEAGEVLDGAVVTRVELHPEYQRYWLRQPGGGEAVAELTTGAGGLCEAAGLTIFPRGDLSGEDGRAGMEPLCRRLTERPPQLRARPAEGGPATPTDGPGAPAPGRAEGRPTLEPPRLRPGTAVLRLALLLIGLLGLRAARLDRTLLLVGATAFLVRLALSPEGLVNGALAGYEKLAAARFDTDSPNGAGWPALMGGLPRWPDSVFGMNLLLSSLAPPLLAALVRRSAGGRAGLAAGLFFALLPSHIGVARSETLHVSVVTFELIALLAADAFAREGRAREAALAALAAGMALHIRPDALPFAILPPLWFALRRRSAAEPAPLPWRGMLLGGALLGGLFVWRVLTLGADPGGGGLLRAPGWELLLPRLGAAGPASSFQLFWHAGLTPPVLGGLTLFGLARLARHQRSELTPWLLWAALTTLPVATKVSPLVDALRLQLSAQAPWLALAGIGLTALPAWALPASLLTLLPSLRISPWVQTQEWQFLRAAARALPAESVVQVDPRPHRASAFTDVMGALGPARWSLSEGDLRYVGLSCLADGGCSVEGCQLWRGALLDGRLDLDLHLSSRRVGLYRCP